MEAMREAWSDERLDDLANRMDRGFDRVDSDVRELRVETKAEFAVLRGEMSERFDRVDHRFERIETRFDRIEACFDSMQRMIIAAYLTAVVGLIATRF
jgi:hypothetical protein